jgi:hypothetical protein
MIRSRRPHRYCPGSTGCAGHAKWRVSGDSTALLARWYSLQSCRASRGSAGYSGDDGGEQWGGIIEGGRHHCSEALR